ncbi:MAG: alpha/beta fold hydrolase [Acidobacteriota bacterium]|nr:alpha/beta fold hydrolase [Acidobacteriota bacterium]
MLKSMRRPRYLIPLLIVLLSANSPSAQPQTEPAAGEASFNIFMRSTPVGFEQILLSRSDDGWVVRSRGDLSAPIDLRNQSFELGYDSELRARALQIVGVRSNDPFSLRTTFENGRATSQLETGSEQETVTNTVSPNVVVLPDYFFGGYEMLAWRLRNSVSGEEIPVYVSPRNNTRVRVDQVTTQQIETRSATVVDARVYRISFLSEDSPLTVEVWADASHRLLRVTIPRVALDVVRDDIAGVGTRVVSVSHAGDEAVRVRSEGFALAVTLTTPADREQPEAGWPAVLLVPGPTASDRDGTVAGVPVRGQIAGALADAGFMVARYDRRGIGQSGGRPESAGIQEYADDARSMVRYLDDRDDVDNDRITILGQAVGGWTALLTAARERRADNLVLVGAPGTTGADLVLEQQRALLNRLDVSEEERTERVRLQTQIIDALLEDGSWDGVPEEMRSQADSIWFRSFLEFDTADIMRRARQPILILHGVRDTQIDVHHATRLAELARARRRDVSVEQVLLDDVDHTLIETETGGAPSYDDMGTRTISQSAIDTLITWLEQRRGN